MHPPFVIFSMPRSRSAWISRFLSWGDWHCGHEELLHQRSLEDVQSWLGQPCTGTVETAASPFWRILRTLQPDVRVVVVRRPVDEVVASFMRLPLGYQEATLRPLMERTAAKLDQIERRWPGVLAVTFEDLATEAGCRRVWEHVLPYPHQPDWWAAVSLVNIQVDMRVLVRRFRAYQPQLEKLAQIAKHRIVSDMRPAEREFDGLTFQTQPFSEFVRDAKALIINHCALVGRKAELDFNVPLLEALDQVGALQVMTARSNGRCFGYLVSIVEPSLDGPDIIQAHHTIFYTAPEVRGLGVRLLMRANDALRERGVSQIWMRAGVVGSGPRMGAVYRRLGAQPWGELYRMEL